MSPVFRANALILSLAASLLFLAGCSGDKADKDVYIERPVDVLYNEAMDQMNDGELDKAAKSFDEVDRQHPYSIWATKAQLMTAYVKYQRNKMDEAIASLDRFIQLHPGHRDVAYAYYLKALCYYEQIADVARDQKMTDRALKSLQELIDRFPNSRYARDAKLKLDLARDHLAGKEMSVGRYYEKQSQYLAAINRFRTVINDFQTTTHVPEALHRLVECYVALGLTEEAKKTAAILGFNYPGSSWYADTYKLVRVTDSTLPQPEKSSGWLW